MENNNSKTNNLISNNDDQRMNLNMIPNKTIDYNHNRSYFDETNEAQFSNRKTPNIHKKRELESLNDRDKISHVKTNKNPNLDNNLVHKMQPKYFFPHSSRINENKNINLNYNYQPSNHESNKEIHSLDEIERSLERSRSESQFPSKNQSNSHNQRINVEYNNNRSSELVNNY